MPATITRAPNIKGLIARYSPPHQVVASQPKARQSPRAPVAVHNRVRPATQPAAPAVMRPAGRTRPAAPVQDIYARHPMLREIADLEALAMQATWEQAGRNDQANSSRSGFRFHPASAARVMPLQGT